MLTVARFKRNMADIRTGASLARQAQVEPQRYRAWETGREFYYLRPDEIQRIAEVLQTTPAELADEKGHALLWKPREQPVE